MPTLPFRFRDAGSLVHRHGHVIDHLMFLHQRFMLELSRMSLVVKELTVCNRMVNAHQSSGGRFETPAEMNAASRKTLSLAKLKR